MSKPAFLYNAKANPDGGTYAGVPLADLTAEAFNALPNHLKLTILQSPMYERQKGVTLDLPDAAPAGGDPPPSAEPAQPATKKKE